MGVHGFRKLVLTSTDLTIKDLWNKFNQKSMEYSFLLQLKLQYAIDYGAPEE